MGSLHEECGIFGIYSQKSEDVASLSYYALYALQHRGQEGCGIALNERGVITCHKDKGLVNEVFKADTLPSNEACRMAIAHVRYGTTDVASRTKVQPLVITHQNGSMALAHNGSLTNGSQLREKLELSGSIFHTTGDPEVIAYLITRNRLCCPSIEVAIEKTMEEIKGAYSLLVMSPSKLIAIRDPWGFRPLCIGKLGDGYVFASESCSFDAVGAEFIRDVEPGEIVVVDTHQGSEPTLVSIRTFCNTQSSALCLFELLYFARPDSIIDTISIHQARLRAGAFLALEHPAQADVVIGVPDSGIDAAIGYSRQSGIPYGIGFIKNRYIGRTFIQPGQSSREDHVRIKLNPIAATVRGKRVVLIDDSIVRGTTSKRIVRLLREAGAKEVHLRSASPKFLYPCYFGTDINSSEDLFAYKHDDETMLSLLDVDSLGFLSSENVNRLSDHPSIGFCSACFTGKYPCSPPQCKSKGKYMQFIGGESTHDTE